MQLGSTDTIMLHWGKTDSDVETVTLPTRSQYHLGVRTLGESDHNDYRQLCYGVVGCGHTHTVALLEDGSLLSSSGRGHLGSAAVRLSECCLYYTVSVCVTMCVCYQVL